MINAQRPEAPVRYYGCRFPIENYEQDALIEIVNNLLLDYYTFGVQGMQQIMQNMFRWTQFTEKIYTTVAWLPVQFPVQCTWYIRNILSSGNLLASPCTTDHICIMHKVIDIPIDYPGQSSTSNYIPRKKIILRNQSTFLNYAENCA